MSIEYKSNKARNKIGNRQNHHPFYAAEKRRCKNSANVKYRLYIIKG